MKTIYLNLKTQGQTETVDEFTRGEDAPQNPREFRAYINVMIREYRGAGMQVYKSQRACKDWD